MCLIWYGAIDRGLAQRHGCPLPGMILIVSGYVPGIFRGRLGDASQTATGSLAGYRFPAALLYARQEKNARSDRGTTLARRRGRIARPHLLAQGSKRPWGLGAVPRHPDVGLSLTTLPIVSRTRPGA
jgi:hypothetical protein